MRAWEHIITKIHNDNKPFALSVHFPFSFQNAFQNSLYIQEFAVGIRFCVGCGFHVYGVFPCSQYVNMFTVRPLFPVFTVCFNVHNVLFTVEFGVPFEFKCSL